MIPNVRTITRKGYLLFPVSQIPEGLKSKVGHLRVSVNSINKAGKTLAVFLVKTQESAKVADFDFADTKKAIEIHHMMPASKQYTSHLRSHLGSPMSVFGDMKRGSYGHIEVILTMFQNKKEMGKFLIWKSDTNAKFSVEDEAHDVAKKHGLRAVYTAEVILVDGVRRKVLGVY